MSAMTHNDDPLLDIPAAAEYLSQTPRWIRRRLEERELAHVKLGGRVMFRRSMLDRLIERSTVEPADGLRHG